MYEIITTILITLVLVLWLRLNKQKELHTNIHSFADSALVNGRNVMRHHILKKIKNSNGCVVTLEGDMVTAIEDRLYINGRIVLSSNTDEIINLAKELDKV